MYWDYCCPKKSLKEEDFWKESIKDIKRIVKGQESAKMSGVNFKHMVTEMRAEMAQLAEKQDKYAEVILDMMTKIDRLLENQEVCQHASYG